MPDRKTVIISSTARDLPKHRQTVMDACLRQGMFPLMMEHLPASDADVIEVSLKLVEGKVHHKFAVIDVEGDDRVAIVGSYNWTAAGAYDNDENTLIIHDRELARAYYAEWQRLWAAVPVERVCDVVTVWLPVVVNN